MCFYNLCIMIGCCNGFYYSVSYELYMFMPQKVVAMSLIFMIQVIQALVCVCVCVCRFGQSGSCPLCTYWILS